MLIRAAAIALVASAGSVSALTLAQCERTTHNWHAGEARHTAYDDGRVAWAEWWSNEGVFVDYIVMACESGDFLKTRVVEEHISDRWFNRRAQARDIFARELASDFFSFQRLATALKGVGRDIEIATANAESCGCAAAYPALRGDKTGFELEE
ncbi:MAG: hypothetical protein AAGF55_12725 [Pseudomonadota bacterium]